MQDSLFHIFTKPDTTKFGRNALFSRINSLFIQTSQFINPLLYSKYNHINKQKEKKLRIKNPQQGPQTHSNPCIHI